MILTDATKTTWPSIVPDRIEREYFIYSRYKPGIHLVKITSVEPVEKIFAEYVDFTYYTGTFKGALIVDISDAKYLSSEQRIRLGKSVKDNTEMIRKNWTSISYVNTSVMSSIILKGILFANPLPVKSKVFTSLEEAVKWSEKNL